MGLRDRVRWAALLAGATLLPAGAGAQVAPPPPDVRPPTREEVERLRPAPGPRVQADTALDAEIERAPCPLAEPKYQALTFTLADVAFEGLRGVPAELLREAWAGDVGKTIPVARICEIRDRAATLLRRAGYLAAVQVPPQTIDQGRVRFDVLMAKLVGLQVRGQAGRAEGLIARYLAKIQAQEVFNIRDAERYLLLARDLPGYDVRLILRPAGTVPGEVIGEVAVLRTPIEVDANVQNFGSRAVGRFGGLARVQLNGLTGLGDRTTLSVFSTLDFDEQQVVQAGHSMKLGGEGLTLSGDLTYAWTKPSIALNFPLEAETLSAFVEASYPFVRRQTETLQGAIGLNIVDQDVDFGADTLTRDRLRVAYARLDYDAVDPRSVASTSGFSLSEPRWRVAGSLELRQGLDLGASGRCLSGQPCLLSRFGADPTAFVARALGLVELRPVRHVAVSIAPRAQYAPHALLSYEEYSVGNFTLGRGFDPGAIAGDSGLGFQSEVRFGSLVPRSRKDLALQPFGFFDLGLVWNRDLGQRGFHQELYSAGGGIRATWGDQARLDLTLAVPLNRAPLQTDRDVRLLFSLTTKLVPWRR